ncbi:unnamed protein product [Anisakis simplex]|uniref:BLOC-1-related complex subunit 5 n=1 Tax=Anisakis simplex TaxID=6269 RepID=A0A0M3JS80_ANISI|nr:unnamed protein product [Anisakis simplex]
MRSELNKGGCVNRSEDDLRASPSKVFEVHSKGVSDQRSVELSRKLSAAKKNQVDETIQQLTEKCHRIVIAVQSNRNAHHGELSKSIENMLENALKRTDTPGDDHRSLNHQLNTLLNAFDAIEKYLSQVCYLRF